MKLHADFYTQLSCFLLDFARLNRGPYVASFTPDTHRLLDHSRLPAGLSVTLVTMDLESLAVCLEGAPTRQLITELGTRARHEVTGQRPSDWRVLTNDANAVELLDEACS